MIDYDPHNWFDHLCDIKGSLVREIAPRVGFCVLFSILVTFFHLYIEPVHIPATVHSLVGVALGLLLVFRTNASYDRFWEGRKLWGGIVNESRNLARQSRGLIAPGAPELHRALALWVAAFAYAAMNSLRGGAGLGPPAEGLPREEVE